MNSNVKKNRDHARPLPARSGQPSSADSSPAGPDAAGPDAAGPDGRHKDGKHKDGKEGGSRWTFLTNHSHVLIVLDSEPELVLREVAARVGITERAVQRVVQDLEEGGFIRRERVGRDVVPVDEHGA